MPSPTKMQISTLGHQQSKNKKPSRRKNNNNQTGQKKIKKKEHIHGGAISARAK